LDDYNLSVAPGAVIHLDGPSGSGKTTVLRLIAGLHEPQLGQIRVFGQRPRQSRHSIYYLPQRVHLFDGTILDNLSILSGAEAEQLRVAAVCTHLDEWVSTLPLGYDTPIRAGANNLSGGQRQLIAVTAAIASHRPLLLLDEALANLDRPTQARLIRDDVLAGRTVIMVTHHDTVANHRRDHVNMTVLSRHEFAPDPQMARSPQRRKSATAEERLRRGPLATDLAV
jgi:ATP-binding cassette subfamily B protein